MVRPAGSDDGDPGGAEGLRYPARYNLVSADYFQVMGIGLTAGRGFTEEETRQGAAVADGEPVDGARVLAGRGPGREDDPGGGSRGSGGWRTCRSAETCG